MRGLLLWLTMLGVSACSSDPGGIAFPGSAGGGGTAPALAAGAAPVAPPSGTYDPVAIQAVKPSAGCGQSPPQATGQFVRYTVPTSGTKDASAADSKRGAWSYDREYAVWLPADYDPSHAYPLVFQAPGCGGTSVDVYTLATDPNAFVTHGVNGSVIRVGLTPPPDAIGHSTSPNSLCFDDHEGNDSVEWPFYEAVVDRLKQQLCFDENRVFASGARTGAVLAEELACRYAGNAQGYAIRGLAVSAGTLPEDPRNRPTCTGQPIAGAWIVMVDDPTTADKSYQYAISRALVANHCEASSFDQAAFEDFPLGRGLAAKTCQKIVGCPSELPLIVCMIPGPQKSTRDDIANPAFAKLIQSLAGPESAEGPDGL